MELNVVEKRENKLLNRTEVKFKIMHEGEKTPEREIVRSDLAELLKVKKDLVIIDHIKPNFGMPISYGYAKIYKSKEDAEHIEPEYLLKRNKVEEKKEEAKEEKKEEEKKEEAPEPTEEKPGEKSEGDEGEKTEEVKEENTDGSQ